MTKDIKLNQNYEWVNFVYDPSKGNLDTVSDTEIEPVSITGKALSRNFTTYYDDVEKIILNG